MHSDLQSTGTAVRFIVVTGGIDSKHFQQINVKQSLKVVGKQRAGSKGGIHRGHSTILERVGDMEPWSIMRDSSDCQATHTATIVCHWCV